MIPSEFGLPFLEWLRAATEDAWRKVTPLTLEHEPSVVLSVHQSDIIVYGSDLRAFLLHELCDLLGVQRDPAWMNADTRSIPFWGELIG